MHLLENLEVFFPTIRVVTLPSVTGVDGTRRIPDVHVQAPERSQLPHLTSDPERPTRHLPCNRIPGISRLLADPLLQLNERQR